MTFNIANKNLKSAASSEDIENAQLSLTSVIPILLVELWRISNGLINDGGILIYATDEINERNETMEVSEYDKTLLMFGDDSGGNGFFFNVENKDDISVYSLDFGAIGSLSPDKISDNFYEWINEQFA